ncbi:MAG TPA: hypothetical protein VF515_10335 [Candidatus Binatia bacterium]
MSTIHHSHRGRRGRRRTAAIVDTGGTFTDLIAFLGAEMRTLKVL